MKMFLQFWPSNNRNSSENIFSSIQVFEKIIDKDSFAECFNTLSANPYKMVKHTQTIRRQ